MRPTARSGRQRRLLFATRNPGKLAELRALVGELGIQVSSLDEFDRDVPEVVEDGDTFAANAIKKARVVSTASGMPALADDSGLEVTALDGAPGVYSARYAGEHASDADNNARLLRALQAVPEPARTARFCSVLALADVAGPLGGDVITAMGVCEGRIIMSPRGSGGFGYDPLFYCPELGATFAEASEQAKNRVSHRARAMAVMKPRIADYFRLENPGDSG